MNKERRKEIKSLMTRLEELKDEIDSVRQDEADYMDAIPENLMYSAVYMKAEDAVNNLDNAIACIEEAMESLDTAME